MAEADEFPPRVPCPGRCEYGACGDPGIYSGPYGCGGCCRCLGGCHLEYEVEQAMIPETPEQARMRERWETLALGNDDFRAFPL
jgi:hypothetical protein